MQEYRNPGSRYTEVSVERILFHVRNPCYLIVGRSAINFFFKCPVLHRRTVQWALAVTAEIVPSLALNRRFWWPSAMFVGRTIAFGEIMIAAGGMLSGVVSLVGCDPVLL